VGVTLMQTNHLETGKTLPRGSTPRLSCGLLFMPTCEIHRPWIPTTFLFPLKKCENSSNFKTFGGIPESPPGK
jgi:hypothetical protein